MTVELNPENNNSLFQDLDQTRAFLATVEKIANIGCWDWDMNTSQRSFTEQFYIICGYTPGDPELNGETVEKLIHPDDLEEAMNAIKDAVDRKLPYRVEKRLLLRDKTVKHVISQGRVFYKNNQPVTMIGILQDITEQKRTELQLKDRESALLQGKEFAESIWESMSDGFAITDVNGVFIHVNQALCEMTGFSKEEYIGAKPPHPDWPKEEYATFFEAIKEAFRGNLQEVVLIYQRKNGERFPAKVTPSLIRDANGTITNFYGVVKDITQQKQVEEQLRKSEAKNTAIITALPDIIFILNEEGEYLDIIAKDPSRLLAKPEELLGRKFQDFLSPELSDSIMQSFSEARATGIPQLIEYPIDLDGTTLYFEARIVTLEENTFLTIIRDITQRKKAVMALKKEKETTQTYLDIAEVIFVIIGLDQNIKMINKRGCEILEYEEHELIGKNWFDTIIKEEVKDEVKAGFVDVIQEKREVRRQTESFVVTKSGKELIMAWSNTVIRDKEGLPIATLSSGSDLTAIKNAEVEAELAVIKGQELERKRIAEELHDGVGSLLSAVKLNFDHLVENISKDDELAVNSEKLNDLLLNAMDEIRSISHNLKPSTIDSFGLVNTLEDLCKDISNTQSALVNFQSFGLDKRLDYIQEIGLYRIAQELINNSVKHAQAKRIDVKLIEHDSYVLMMIEDDGIGFDSTHQLGNGGMGLKNVDSRVRSLKGSYDIDALAGRGTLITVEIPKQPAYGKN